MPETARSKPLEIWFQDEARVGQQGTLTRIWAERGTRPRAPRDTRYIWSYIFGAVCPERAEAAALIMPHADTQAMSAHLAEIAKTVASGAHALLILDGAGWHGSAELEVPDNITLLKLPPYSPERGKCVGEAMLKDTENYPFIGDVIDGISVGRTAFYRYFPPERIRQLRPDHTQNKEQQSPNPMRQNVPLLG